MVISTGHSLPAHFLIISAGLCLTCSYLIENKDCFYRIYTYQHFLLKMSYWPTGKIIYSFLPITKIFLEHRRMTFSSIHHLLIIDFSHLPSQGKDVTKPEHTCVTLRKYNHCFHKKSNLWPLKFNDQNANHYVTATSYFYL